MAKGIFVKTLEILRGKVAGLVVRRRPDSAFIFSEPLTYEKDSWTPAQKVHRKYVSQVGPYFAFVDCMKSPVIHRIERRVGCICILASDNVMVKRVWVFVLDESGRSLNNGDATRADGDWWEYATHGEGKRILVLAFDLPGNCTELEI